MNEIRLIIETILPRIVQLSRNNKQRDVLSLLYLFAIVLTLFMGFITMIKILTPFLVELGVQIFNTYSYIDSLLNNKPKIIQYSANLPRFNFVDELLKSGSESLRVLPIAVVPTYRLIIKKQSFRTEWIAIVLMIVALLVSYDLYFEFLGIVGILFSLLIFFPLGEGGYFKIIQYLNYLEEIISTFQMEHPKQDRSSVPLFKNFVIIVIILLSIIVINYSLIRLFHFTTVLATMISLVIILLMWMNKSKSRKEIYLLKKLIIYFIFLCATIIGNYQADSNVIKLPLLFVSLFFTLDRVIALSNEVYELSISKSVLYYYDHTDISEDVLLSQIVNLYYLENIDLTESELVRQLLIRLRLGLNDEFFTLSKIYKHCNYHNYIQLVETNEYFLKYEESWAEDLEALKDKVKKIVEYSDQKIFSVRIFEEYATILFYLGDYSECIEYFNLVFLYLDKDSLDLLSSAYEKIENFKSSKQVKNIVVN